MNVLGVPDRKKESHYHREVLLHIMRTSLVLDLVWLVHEPLSVGPSVSVVS
ncbi:unnamed protein product [Lupinus luteus]|uniref:Uncharacterized protein n=1 Tax=Lupinus luteus TaxID=3873 RepID=A0AAV1X004_LUPLU